MTRRPWFPLYHQDWLLATADMTLEEQGAYMRLLAVMYDRRAPLPNDDSKMAKVVGVNVRRWKRLKSALVEGGKLTVTDAGIVNDRAAREMGFADVLEKNDNKLAKDCEKIDEKPSKHSPQAIENIECGPLAYQNHIPEPDNVVVVSARGGARTNQDLEKDSELPKPDGQGPPGSLSETVRRADAQSAHDPAMTFPTGDEQQLMALAGLPHWKQNAQQAAILRGLVDRWGLEPVRCVLDAVNRERIKAGRPPPNSMKYFEPALAERHRQQTEQAETPAPSQRKPANGRNPKHAKPRRSTYAGAQGLADLLATKTALDVPTEPKTVNAQRVDSDHGRMRPRLGASDKG